MNNKTRLMLRLSLASILATSNIALAEGEVFQKWIKSMSLVDEFCAQDDVRCISIEDRTLAYLVTWEEVAGTTSGPRRGKGGDGDGDEFEGDM